MNAIIQDNKCESCIIQIECRHIYNAGFAAN